MNHKKLWNTLSAIIFVLQLAAEALTLAMVIRLNMLPDGLIWIAGALLAVLAAVNGLLMFCSSKKPGGGNARRVIAWILAALIVLGCGAGATVISDFHGTMGEIVDDTPIDITRSVYVLADNPAASLTDAADYSFGMVENYDEQYTSQALGDLKQELGTDVRVQTYPSVFAMVDALYAKTVDAIILNEGFISILEEMEQYGDFQNRVKVLHVVSIEVTTEQTVPPTTVETEPSTEPKAPELVPFALYLSGSDTRAHHLAVSRSDVNIIAVVNPETKQILLLNTPRDYYIPNPAGGGAMDKLTHCGIYGIECSVEALEDLYDMHIDYSAIINFTGFEKLIDAVGGVTVYSDVSFNTGEFYFQKGENRLNGREALAFARDRYHQPGGDNGRGRNQMKVIKALLEKATSGTTIINNYSKILSSLEGMFRTDMPMEKINEQVKLQLSSMASWNIQNYAVTGPGGHDRTYSSGSGAYVMYQDPRYVNHAKDLVNKVLDGGILTADDMNTP